MMELIKTLRIISVAGAAAIVPLAVLAGLGYWQSNYGYFIKFTPIPKPENFVGIGPNPDQQRAIDNPDQFIRIGFTLDKYNFRGFSEILPEYDYNIEYAEYIPPDYKDLHLEYYHVTIKHIEAPVEGVQDLSSWVPDLIFWLIVSCFAVTGTFAMTQYLKNVEA